jgi:hypothetical protein
VVWYRTNQSSSYPGRLPWRALLLDVQVQPGDPLNIQTGVFQNAGAQTVLSMVDYPWLPWTAELFVADQRWKIWRNGQLTLKLKAGDYILIEAPGTFQS